MPSRTTAFHISIASMVSVSLYFLISIMLVLFSFVIAKFFCKVSDNRGIFSKFAQIIRNVYKIRMDYNSKSIIMSDSLDGLFSAEMKGYVAHVFCEAGTCRLCYNSGSTSERATCC